MRRLPESGWITTLPKCSMRAAGALLSAALVMVGAGCAAGMQPGTDPGAVEIGDGPVAGQRSAAPTAEDLHKRVAPFELSGFDGSPVDFPFLGGIEVPRVQLVDIDGDGDLDLFLQQRPSELIYFENTGTPTEADFTWRSDRFHELAVGDWSRFVDLDGDGDLDVLAEERFSYIRMFENRGSPVAPEFALVADSIRTSDGTPIFSDRQNIPFIVDLDCDGALDLFLGRIDGTVSRFEAPRAFSSGEIPVFDLVTDRFEDIEIVAQLGGGGPSLHGANSMVFMDFDRDEDLDLLWGDFFEPGLLLIENVGNCWSPNLRVDPVPFPAEDTIQTSGYNASAVGDLDGDGLDELLIGVLGGAYNPVASSARNLHLYDEREDGVFELVTRSYLRTFDVGTETVPALGDVDGDGDLDLLVGSKVDPEQTSMGRLHYLENTGSATAPRYAWRDTLGLSTHFHQAPELGDLDGDGRLDLLLGNWRANVEWWRNDGVEAGRPIFTRVDSAVAELPRGGNTVPALGDLDGDGDLDLLVGEAAGNVNFFRNEGTAQEPRFVLETEEYAGIDAGRRAAPELFDWDGDGDLDLFVGSEGGGLRLWENRGTATEPRFVEVADFDLTLYPYSTVTWGDLDGDGDPDLVAGGSAGGLVYFEMRPGG